MRIISCGRTCEDHRRHDARAHACRARRRAPCGRPRTRCARRSSTSLRTMISGAGFVLEGARVCDLFAGTGALGIEALSHGARFALLVDDAAESRALIRTNVEALGLTGVTKIWRRDATNLGPLAAGSGGPFELAFLDPPYRQNLAAHRRSRRCATERGSRPVRSPWWRPPRMKMFRLRTDLSCRTSASRRHAGGVSCLPVLIRHAAGRNPFISKYRCHGPAFAGHDSLAVISPTTSSGT